MHILTWRNARNHTRSRVLAGSWEGEEAATGLTFPSRYQTALFFSPDIPSGHFLSTFHWPLQSKGAVINNMRTLSLSLIWAILIHIKKKNNNDKSPEIILFDLHNKYVIITADCVISSSRKSIITLSRPRIRLVFRWPIQSFGPRQHFSIKVRVYPPFFFSKLNNRSRNNLVPRMHESARKPPALWSWDQEKQLPSTVNHELFTQ